MVAAAAPALCWDDNDPFVLQMRHLSPPQKKEAASIKSRDQTTLRSHRGLQISAAPRRKSPERAPALQNRLLGSAWGDAPSVRLELRSAGASASCLCHNRKR